MTFTEVIFVVAVLVLSFAAPIVLWLRDDSQRIAALEKRVFDLEVKS